MNFGDELKYQNVRDQWYEITIRLNVVGGIDVPEEYDQIGDRVYEARRKVAHNKNHDPDKSNLLSLREIAPEWRDWLRNAAETFSDDRGALSPYEAIIELILNNIEAVKKRPDPKGNPIAMEEAHLMKRDADAIADEVKSIEHNHKNLEKLTQYLMMSVTLRKDIHNLSRDPEKYVDPPGPDEPLFTERIDDWDSTDEI
jgi:hypothetical protein